MSAKAGANAGAKAGAKAGAEVYDKFGAKAGVWLAAKAGVEAGTKAGAKAGAEACIKAGDLDGASAGAKTGATAGAKAGAKAGAEAYDKAFVASNSMRDMWSRGWPKADTEARAKALAEKEAYKRVSGIPPPFFMEKSEFTSKSYFYTEVFRYSLVNMDFWKEMQKRGKCYEIITIDMNKMFEEELTDRVQPENRPWKTFVTINNGESQQYFVRNDYWQKNSKYLGSVLDSSKGRVSFTREHKPYYGRTSIPKLTDVFSDKGHNQTYYREVECHVEEEEDTTCLGSICNVSGGKSIKNRKKSNRRKSTRRRL